LETTVCLAVISVCYKSSRLFLLNPKLSAGILSIEFQKDSLKRVSLKVLGDGSYRNYVEAVYTYVLIVVVVSNPRV
jgi:hypothetical protein